MIFPSSFVRWSWISERSTPASEIEPKSGRVIRGPGSTRTVSGRLDSPCTWSATRSPALKSPFSSRSRIIAALDLAASRMLPEYAVEVAAASYSCRRSVSSARESSVPLAPNSTGS